jgi:predicted  nucleic acid-binding Zn-ribbon protein
MAEAKKQVTDLTELTIEEKLRALYNLQKINSDIDKIRTLRGELPLEVQDLEDEIAGLETRIEKLQEEIKSIDSAIAGKKNDIANSRALIKKYEEQQNNVRNNREFDSLSKEIEYQTLEIELSEKRIKEFTAQAKEKNEYIDESKKILEERKNDLNLKKSELEEITSDTQKEEEQLLKKRQEYELIIEERLLTAYKKIRKNARNGLAVVSVERDACGGCFNQIPPQRQLDIRSRKKIIVCEYCGRILVDIDLVEEEK